MTPRKLAGLAVLAIAIAGVGVVSRDAGLTTAFALLALGLAVVSLLLVDVRRRLRVTERELRRSRTPRRARASTAAAQPVTREEPPASPRCIGGLASMPSRVDALGQAVASILPQLDTLHVFLNDYEQVPDFLRDDRIVVHRSQDHGNLHDNGKFFGLRFHEEGIYFTLDDDLIYPADYVESLLASLRKLRFDAIVGVHGVYYRERPVSFLDRKLIGYGRANHELRPVSLLGTGTVAFPIELVGVSLDAFATPRMADVWFAVHAKKNGIPMLAVPRREGWVQDAQAAAGSSSIWDATRDDHRLPTSVLRDQMPWGLVDLVQRLHGRASARYLPRSWKRLVRLMDARREHGPAHAVGELTTEQRVSKLIPFYAEAPHVLELAQAAFASRGYRSTILHRAHAVARRHDPHAAARLFEAAMQQALEHDRRAATTLAVRASAAYRSAGEYDRAERILSGFVDEWASHAGLAGERIALAMELRRFDEARDAILAASPILPRNATYDMRMAKIASETDGLAAAVPWVTELLLRDDAAREHRWLVSQFRSLRDRGETVAGRFPFDAVERAAERGAIDPLPAVHLLLALGDRVGASELLQRVEATVGSSRPDYLPVLRAALESSLDTVVPVLNDRLRAAGLAELRTKADATKTPFPLARLEAACSAHQDDRTVTVIVSAYNCEDTLPYALSSILAQSVRSLEVIVIDDASTDGTPAVISRFADSDPRVVAHRLDRNGGPYVSRNAALKLARGDVIAVHDADDYAHPQRIERQLEALDRDEVVACYASHVRMSDDGALVPENHGEIVGEGPMTLMISRQVLDELGYFLPARSRADIEHRERMLHYYGSHRIAFLPEVLVIARDASTTNSRVFEVSPEHVGTVPRLKALGRRRHERAAGRREHLYVPDHWDRWDPATLDGTVTSDGDIVGALAPADRLRASRHD